jgi:transcriptional regulator with XRE-family HTH domain
MPAKPLNKQELAEAAQLKSLFQAWQAKRKEQGEAHSQEAAAALLGFGQSALNQYLGGKIPLNIAVAVTFAREFGVRVDQFSPTIASEIRTAAMMVEGAVTGASLEVGAPKWISEDAFHLLDLYYRCDSRGKVEVMATASDYAIRTSLPGAAANEA